MKDIYQLKKGQKYKVIKTLTDFNKTTLEIGKNWIFDKITYLPYHNGVSLFVIENGISWKERSK